MTRGGGHLVSAGEKLRQRMRSKEKWAREVRKRKKCSVGTEE